MKKLHFISQNWRKENRTVACGFSPIKTHYSDYPKRINEVYVFLIKYNYSNILFKKKHKLFLALLIVECCNRLFRCNHTSYCVGMVSVKPASRYQSRPSMYIRCLIPWNWLRQFRLRQPRHSKLSSLARWLLTL